MCVVQHTSASLCINENADSDVPKDMEDALNRLAAEGDHYRHDAEGSDDMPAHIKSALFGVSLTIPVTAGALNLGTWQGIWLCEHRNDGGSRRIVITINGMAEPVGPTGTAVAAGSGGGGGGGTSKSDEKSPKK